MMTASTRAAAPLLALLLSGCLPWAGVVAAPSGSQGTVSRGLLEGGERLAARGKSYRFYRPGRRQWGTPELNGLIVRASDSVAAAHPGSVLLVGDMSAREGGFIGGHRSHRSGRDVDFAFYSTDPGRRPVDGFPLVHFDRFGVGVREGRAVRFDAERNWLLVEALLTDTKAAVQWLFVSEGVKALLLEWALEGGRPHEIIERAATVLHQPRDALPHDDHFHLRIYCPPKPRSPYCRDRGPVWPWVKGDEPGPGLSDSELAAMALEG
jgi:penicillin-insensitive murein endopeptidase